MQGTLADYCRRASRFKWAEPPHLTLITDVLEHAATTPNSRVMLVTPPRHGKSMTTSQFFPSWHVLKFPDKRIILSSYSGGFAASWGRKVRNLVMEWGPYMDLLLDPASKASDEWYVWKHDGGMLTTGMEGGATGRGADLLLIDDPIKDALQARSKVYRERAWDWWLSTIGTRLEPGASVVLIQTRWHEDDLAGRILEAEAAEWKVIVLPAVAEIGDPLGRAIGEPLWPARYDSRWMERERIRIGPYWWSALFQGRPAPADGQVFHRAGIRFFTDDPQLNAYVLHSPIVGAPDVLRPKAGCLIYQTVDLAVTEDESNDYTVISTWALTQKAELLWLNCVRAHVEGPDQLPLVHKEFERFHPAYIGVEDTQYQLAFVQALRAKGLPVKRLKPRGDKYARALTAGALWDAGKVFTERNASWAAEVHEEAIGFPHARHDDAVDTLAYAGIEAQGQEGGIAAIYGVVACARCGHKFVDQTGGRPCPRCGSTEIEDVA